MASEWLILKADEVVKKTVKDDGNCLLRACYRWGRRPPPSPEADGRVRARPDLMQEIFEVEGDDWLEKQKRNKTFSDSQVMRVLAEVLGRPIIALCKNMQTGFVYDEQHYPSDREMHGQYPIYVYYDGYIHYDRVDENWLYGLLASRGLSAAESAQGFVKEGEFVILAEGKKEGGKKRKGPPRLKSRKEIEPDGLVAADGDDAHVEEAKYIDPRTQLAGNLSSRRYRAWDGAVPLRDPSLSDSVAESYFDRFLGLVQFVDDFNEGQVLESVWDYFALENVRAWLYWFLENPRQIKATGIQKAYTPSYLNSLVRTLRALGKCFVGDPETDEDAAEWFKGLKLLLQKVVSELKRSPKLRDGMVVEDEAEADAEGALVFLAKEKQSLVFQGAYGELADIWSVGVITYEALYGYRPFNDANIDRVEEMVRNWQRYLLFPFDAAELPTNFIRLMLADPQDRSSASSVRSHRWLRSAGHIDSELPATGSALGFRHQGARVDSKFTPVHSPRYEVVEAFPDSFGMQMTQLGTRIVIVLPILAGPM
ncbi:CPK28 [Symbiodinium sp. CCMP2592]|nr:CPK28 [Symbiodinium sp. CCMP2592]